MGDVWPTSAIRDLADIAEVGPSSTLDVLMYFLDDQFQGVTRGRRR